ncbi:hypothetical protein LUZ61_012040 [Rhynchospora tenuis]|uniref:Alpha-D-phosphohexomutase C-terminal domain-containing protein n=1 Tax=Rhynchospora tenuis TaxID=198213 RepID=A0AAD6A2B1_9POAL|nr:hypothetical protein LUZ61_012040 [Rhynchospora tenuis]
MVYILIPSGTWPHFRCASLDGDADRLIFFRLIPNSNNKIELVDGDKILSLFAIFIQEQLSLLEELPARLGVVQTAYANGAATDYLRNLGLEVIFTTNKPSSRRCTEWVAFGRGNTSQQRMVFPKMVRSIPRFAKPSTQGMLLSLFIKFAELQYRTAIVTADAETRVVKPAALQELIDTETAKYTHGRCFVRPSGTEDVVRIYAEAATQDSADSLANSVAQHVNHILGSDIKT